MVDEVKLSFGLSQSERDRRIGVLKAPSVGTSVVTAASGNPENTPREAEPKVGYTPHEATGEVPKSTKQEENDAYIAPVKATVLEAVGAGMGSAGIQYIRDIKSALIYQRDPNFNGEALSAEWFTQNGAGTPDEVRYLAAAKTYEDWVQKTDNIDDTRLRARAMGDHPIAAGLGSVIDADLLATAVPIVGWGSKAGTVARATNRAAAAAVGVGATKGVQSTLGDGLLRTDAQKNIDAGIVGLARLVAPLAKGAAVVDAAGATITPIKSVSVSAEDAAKLNAEYKAASDKAKAITLNNAEIDSLPRKGRGAARRALLASKKAEAQAKVDAEFLPQLEHARLNAETAETAETVSSEARIQSLAQEIESDLMKLSALPQGTAAKTVASNKLIASIQSTWDELHYLTGGDTNTVVNKLLSNPAVNNGDDVVSAQLVYMNNYNNRLMVIEDSLKDAVAATGVKSNFITRRSGAYGKAINEVSGDFQVALQKIDAEGVEYFHQFNKNPSPEYYEQLILKYADKPHIQDMVRKYINSGLAEQVHKDLSGKGILIKEVPDAVTGEIKVVDAMGDIVRRPTYMPLRHSIDAIENTVRSGKATIDEIADFVGAQIARQYPDLLAPKNASKTFKLTERQLGQHFIQTQKSKGGSIGDITALGMNKEQIATLLTRTGEFSEKEARVTAKSIFASLHSKGISTPKNLRRRMDWDWNLGMRTESGHSLTMRDLVDNNVVANLEDYTRGMAHKLGLADYGIKSENDLKSLLEGYLDKLPKDANKAQSKQFMENTYNSLLGKPIDNNPVPAGIRSAQAVADLFLLANSGLYTFVDIATQMQKVGLLKSLPHFKRGMGTMFKDMKNFSPVEAKTLEDILTGRILSGSRHRNFSVRYADNFEVSGGIHEAAQYYGQTARFMNLSESLKRFQVGVLSGVYVSNLKGAMKGSAAEMKFMKDKLMINDELFSKMQKEYTKHGDDIDAWSNDIRIKYEQKLFHDSDNFAMSINNGEVPAILEYSSVGRIIFPYMRFALGMQNKVLRRTLSRDGAAGLAMLMAVQIPTAILIGAAINVRLGKEPTDGIEVLALRSMTALGALNYPIEVAMGGLDGGGVTAIAPFDKTYKLGKELARGASEGELSPTQVLKNSPIYSNVVLGYLMLAVEDKEKPDGY